MTFARDRRTNQFAIYSNAARFKLLFFGSIFNSIFCEMSKTPEGESRTVSLTGQEATDGPTPPKSEMKKPQLK